MRPVFVSNIEKSENRKWKVRGDLLVGDRAEIVDQLLTEELDLNEIYLLSTSEQNEKDSILPLSPFLLYEYNSEAGCKDLYFYNSAWRTKLEYLSHATGGYYFHKELHQGFESLIKIKFKPGIEEDPYQDLSKEERSWRAEDLVKRARLNMEKQPEESLELLEHAIEYYRDASIFYQIAVLQERLGDPPDAILQTLDHALEINPEHEESVAMRMQLLSRTPEESSGTNSENNEQLANKKYDLSSSQYWLEHFPNPIKAVTPSAFRKQYMIFWLGIIHIWYGMSAISNIATGESHILKINLLQYLLCCLFFGSLVIANRITASRFIMLSLQLDTMKLNRFQEWFEAKMLQMYGKYVFSNGKLQFAKTFSGEKWHWLLWLGATIGLATCAFFLSGFQNGSTLFIPVRLVDYGLIYFFAYAALRYVVASTFFIYDFSMLSLKPMLTNINDFGIRSLGPLLSFNFSAASVMYVLYWLMALLAINTNSHTDIFLLGVATVLIGFLSIGLPFAIRRAMKRAKIKPIEQYSHHIEESLKEFLKKPDDPTFERYSWLLKHQRVIRKIPTWPLSWSQTLFFVVGSNILVAFTDVVYIMVRYGYLNQQNTIIEWVMKLF
jgi:tetratricopeptide (TPR) repeat protein